MSELKEVGKLLIHLLKSKGASGDETAGIMLMLQEPQEQWELVKWIAENWEVSMRDVFQKAMDMTCESGADHIPER